jgi:cytidylate kinase
MKTIFNDSKPIILGIAGKAGTGKSTIGSYLAPMGRIASSFQQENEGFYPIFWDHLSFAMPLYRISSIRTGIQGSNRDDRIKYEILDTVLDSFGKSPLFGAPPFQNLIQMVNQLATYPCPQDGSKPRAFLQYAGDVFREEDSHVLIKLMARKIRDINTRFRQDVDQVLADHDEEGTDEVLIPKVPGIVVTDVRTRDEAAFLLQQENIILIKLECDDATRFARLSERDGEGIETLTTRNHETEQQLNTIPDDWFNVIIDTTEMDATEMVTVIHTLGQHFVDGEFVPHSEFADA